MSLELGYITNGFAHHRLDEALEVIAETGYQAVGITLSATSLNPFDQGVMRAARELRRRLQQWGLSAVVETGGRFVLDARRKHWPTLISPDADDRLRRVDFLNRAINLAAELEAGVVSFWSGTREARISDDEAWDLLIDGCDELLTHAVRSDIRLAFEPEPGMFIERMAQFDRLATELNHPRFGLTLDVGHVVCLDDGAPAERIREFGDRLFNVHIEDMRRGVHEHLMFGDGEIDFPPILAALRQIGYHGSVLVELSRHSYEAVTAARRAYEFMKPLCAADPEDGAPRDAN